MRVRIRRFGRLRSGASALARATTNSISRWSSPELPSPSAAVGASPLPWPWGASPLASKASSDCSDFWHLAPSRLTVGCSPFRSALHRARTAARLIRPRLTSRSVSPRRPFRRKARSPQVRALAFPASPPDLRRLTLGRESFAVACPLALVGVASYPVSVRRLASSFPASFSVGLAASRLAVSLGPRDQVPRGLSPPSQSPCWAHKRDGRSNLWSDRPFTCLTSGSPDRKLLEPW